MEASYSDIKDLLVSPFFVGRERELQLLLTEAERDRGSRWLVVGERGVGKTRLMKEVDRRLLGQVQMVNVWASGHEPFDLSRRLRLPGSRWPSKLSSDSSVVLVEDIDQAPLADPEAVNDYLAKNPQVSLFATVRNPQLESGWQAVLDPSRSKVLRLDGLSSREGKELFSANDAVTLPSSVASIDAVLEPSRGNPRLILEWAIGRKGQLAESGERSIETILGPDGHPLRSGGRALAKIEMSVKAVNDRLIATLAENPELMYQLSPRQFEELVAELYSKQGFDVELTRASKDGGFDIYALQDAPFGKFLTIVDCKRHRADRPVEVGLIRQLYGTVMALDASVGVIATTSYFTRGAKAFQAERKHRLGLQDFVSLKDMLQQRLRTRFPVR